MVILSDGNATMDYECIIKVDSLTSEGTNATAKRRMYTYSHKFKFCEVLKMIITQVGEGKINWSQFGVSALPFYL